MEANALLGGTGNCLKHVYYKAALRICAPELESCCVASVDGVGEIGMVNVQLMAWLCEGRVFYAHNTTQSTLNTLNCQTRKQCTQRNALLSSS